LEKTDEENENEILNEVDNVNANASSLAKEEGK
jgi:hypothetical protein